MFLNDANIIYPKIIFYSIYSLIIFEISCNVAFSSVSLFLKVSLLTYANIPESLATLTTLACGLSRGKSALHKFNVPKKFTLIVASISFVCESLYFFWF